MGKVGNWFRNAWNKVKQTAGKVGTWIKDTAVPAVKKYGGKALSIAGKVMNWIPGVPSGIADAVETVGGKINEYVNVLPESLRDKAKEIGDKVIDKGKQAQELAQNVADKAAEYKPLLDKTAKVLA